MMVVLGGTFDPVHFGHLRAALELAEDLAVDQVRFVPCSTPPHREMPRANSAQRLEMLRRATADQRRFAVDTRELAREGVSYMVDTLRSLRSEIGERPLALAVGLDAFVSLDQWHEWRRLTDYAHLVVMRRPGVSMPVRGELAEFMRGRIVADAFELKRLAAGRVLMADVTQLDISATDIRRRMALGKSVRYLLPDVVIDFVEAQGLYRA